MQILFFALSIILLFSLFLYFIPLNLYITAVFSGTELGILELVVMRIRRIPPRPIVFALITATKAGVEVTTAELESHYLAGGNINNVVRSLIMAKQKSLDLTFKQAAAMDLTGKNPVHAVEKNTLKAKME